MMSRAPQGVAERPVPRERAGVRADLDFWGFGVAQRCAKDYSMCMACNVLALGGWL